MKQTLTKFLSVLCFLVGYAQAQDLNTRLQVQRNFNLELKLFDQHSKTFIPLNESTKTNAIYLGIDIAEYKGRYLEINCKRGTSIFVDNYFYKTLEDTHHLFSMDSLLAIFPNAKVQFGFYHPQMDAKHFSAKLIKRVQIPYDQANASLIKRESNPEQDFLIIASLILLLAFASLIRSNPKLTADYVNVMRVLAIREREENILNTRLSSAINLLYYGFCALLAALLFIIVFNSAPERFNISKYTTFDTVLEALAIWGTMTVIIFVLIFLKMIGLYLLTLLFDLRNFLSIHYFNFLRLSILVFGSGVIVSVGYFFSGGQSTQPFIVIMGIMQWLFGLWLIVLFLKLITRAEYRFSHLFSYICASEIIPFLVIIKVIYF